MRSNSNGPVAPCTLASSQAVAFATSSPGISLDASAIGWPLIDRRVSLSPLGVTARTQTASRQSRHGRRRGLAGIVVAMAIDVTDATFDTDVVERSKTTPVVIDLWAPWCGPCLTLGPILEKVTDATEGKVVLAKVNIDENPAISQAFQVQSIPAVFAMKDGQVVDGFMGAYPEDVVTQFVSNLLPTDEETAIAKLIAAGDEDEPALRPADGSRQRGGDRSTGRDARRPWRHR